MATEICQNKRKTPTHAHIQMNSETNIGVPSIIDDDGEYYTEINGYQIPQNIRHRFRSNITAQLLSDRDKVERDKNELAYVNIKQRHRTTPIIVEQPQTVINTDYSKISNDLRTVVCRGHPVQRSSHSKMVHNANIFKDLQADDKHGNLHRRKKDWLGKWTEANIIRDRLYKDILEAQKKPST